MVQVLSLDFGTGSVRAAVYDVEQRQVVALSEAPYATTHPRAGWAEQDPQEWRAAMGHAVRRAMDRAPSRQIAGICVDTTASTVVVSSRDGKALAPAILWMDCRAESEARFSETIDHPVMAWSGHGDAVEWLVPKAMWLKKNDPALWARADVICEAVDYINFLLTGEWVGSQLNATCKWNYDTVAGCFRPELYAALGISDLAEKLPSRIIAVGEVIGPLTRAMAQDLGIEGNPVVAQGGIDAHIGVFGAGAVEPGSMLMIAGTSVVHLTHIDGYRDISGIWGPYPHALVNGLWLLEGGQVSAGSILSWLSNTIFGLDQAGFDGLIAAAGKIEPGSTGLVTLDYWQGNRTPYRDPNLRGAIMGLSLWHDRATLYRSAVDAVALGSANVVGDLARQGVSVDRLVIAGGICKNPLWLASAIDAMGVAAEVCESGNLSLIGGAVSAATALGIFPDLRSASLALAAPTQPREPNPVRSAQYAEMLGHYREATEILAPLSHRIVSRSTGGSA